MDKKTKSHYLKEFSQICSNRLFSNSADKELSYLTNRIPKEYAMLFGFGYFPNDYSQMISVIDEFGSIIKTPPIDVLKEFGIIYQTEKFNKIVSAFRYNSLLIPFYDVYGNIISISGRTILSEDERKEKNVSKYKHIPFEKRRHLYGLNFSYKNIVKKNYCVVVEGQFDFLSGFINGINNIVALGGSKFSFEHIALLKRFTTNFYVLLDNDEAGIAGFDKISKSAEKFEIKVCKLSLPEKYKDIDDYLKENKIGDVRDLVV